MVARPTGAEQLSALIALNGASGVRVRTASHQQATAHPDLVVDVFEDVVGEGLRGDAQVGGDVTMDSLLVRPRAGDLHLPIRQP